MTPGPGAPALHAPDPTPPVAAWIADGASWGDTLAYGPGVADESRLRLLGQLSGKRLLLLGC